MEYHFDTKIVLREDLQHKSLYPWFLREIGNEHVGHAAHMCPNFRVADHRV